MSNNLDKSEINDEHIKDKNLKLKKLNFDKKSKKILIFTIPTLIFIILGVYFIFFNSMNMNGMWTIKNNDIDTILNFKNDGTVSFILSSVEVFGKYEIKPDNKVNIDIKLKSKDVLSGDFSYKIKSDFISKKLELTDSSGKITEYNQCKKPVIKYPVDFKPVDKVVGTWSNDKTDVEYTFTNNGIIKREDSNVIITLTYMIDDSKINFIQMFGNQAREDSINYSFNGEKLVLNGVEFDKK